MTKCKIQEMLLDTKVFAQDLVRMSPKKRQNTTFAYEILHHSKEVASTKNKSTQKRPTAAGRFNATLARISQPSRFASDM